VHAACKPFGVGIVFDRGLGEQRLDSREADGRVSGFRDFRFERARIGRYSSDYKKKLSCTYIPYVLSLLLLDPSEYRPGTTDLVLKCGKPPR